MTKLNLSKLKSKPDLFFQQAILDGEAEVAEWLDSGEVPLAKAVKDLIKPVPKEALSHHPVSTSVNNNKNKTEECTKPIDLE